MITLKTGAIGAAKTLSAVAELAAMQKRWEKHEHEWRPVYVFGVRDLALPHEVLPAYPAGGQPGDPVEFDERGQPKTNVVIEWDRVPPGSLVIIDEAHRAFPVDGVGRAPAPHVAFLDMSRQAGLDIIMITQHPRKLHLYARTSVNKHQHYRRILSFSSSVVYTWDECSQQLRYKDAITTERWAWPKKSFQWYKSSDEVTKVSFKPPAWALVPVAGIVLGVIFAPQAFAVLKGAATGQGVSSSDKEGPKPEPTSGSAAKAGPFPSSSASSPAPEPAPIQLAGCITGPRGGYCIDRQGGRVDLPPDVVAWNARNIGGLVRGGVSSGANVLPPVPASKPTHDEHADAVSVGSYSPRNPVRPGLSGGLSAIGGAAESAPDLDGAVLAAMKGR